MSRHVGPRRFVLMRDTDPTGVSGTGMVAEGVLFSDGKCAMVWRTPYRSVVVYDRLGDLEAVHGHGGATRLVWIDGPDPGDEGPHEGPGPAIMPDVAKRRSPREDR